MSTYTNEINELVSETEGNIYDIERLIYTNRYPFLDKDFKILSKQSLVMLYSLWEGFIQDLFRIFLKEVDRSTVSIFQLKDSFMLSQIEDGFKQFQQYPIKSNARVKFQRDLFSFLSEDNHRISSNIDTKSNVGLDVLNTLLEVHGMEKIPNRWKDYNYPNDTLGDLMNKFLYYRNNQAHGNSLTADVVISQELFQVFKNVVIDLLYEVSSKVEVCLNTESYKQN